MSEVCIRNLLFFREELVMNKIEKCKINKSEIIIILVLTVITSLEPLCIDTYISSFMDIAKSLNTSVANVQATLSVFLGGFAVGQLFWGAISDAVGRRLPILVSLVAFTIATVMCALSTSVEFMWAARFFQAFFGCAPVVISRAVITDSFGASKILFAFSVLAITQGIAPMVGPVLGNVIREYFPWRYIFGAVGIFGAASFLIVLFFLKETNKNIGVSGGFFSSCASVFRDGNFMAANIAGCAIYVALMVYISNSSLVFMEYFGVSGTLFSGIFIANSLAIMLGSVYISGKSGQNKSVYYLKIAFAFTIICAGGFFAFAYCLKSLFFSAAALFAAMFFLGGLFPLTTNLALKPFSESDKSGTASAIFGFSQLGAAFLLTIVLNAFSDNPIVLLPIAFCGCALAGLLPYSLIRTPQK